LKKVYLIEWSWAFQCMLVYVLKLTQIVFIKWNNSEKRTYAHEIIILFESNHSVQIMLKIWLHSIKCTFFNFYPTVWRHFLPFLSSLSKANLDFTSSSFYIVCWSRKKRKVMFLEIFMLSTFGQQFTFVSIPSRFTS